MTAMTDKTLSLAQLQDLAKQPEQVQANVDQILGSLASSDEESRAWASDILCAIEALPEEMGSRLMPFCEHRSPVVASWACKLLVKTTNTKPEWEAAVASTLVSHPETAARTEAAVALGKLSSLSEVSRQKLGEAAGSEDPRLSRMAQRALDKQSS